MEKTIGIINYAANRKVIENLRAKGYKVILLPALKIYKIQNNSEINEIIAKLLGFDWLIFTDIFAVDFFVEILLEKDFDLFELDNLRICAYGEIVADRLRFSQIHADVIPRKLSSELLLKDIKNYIASDNVIDDLSFLVIKEEEAEITLTQKLKSITRNVSEISVYNAKTDTYENLPKLKTLINCGAFDEIMFFSAEDLMSFKKIIGKRSLKEISKHIKLFSKNEIILKAIEELKWL